MEEGLWEGILLLKERCVRGFNSTRVTMRSVEGIILIEAEYGYTTYMYMEKIKFRNDSSCVVSS